MLPLLAEGASVILTGSTAATTGSPGFSVYGASKAAVRAFVRNWILEVDKSRKIRFNTLSPGPTRTPGLVGLVGPDADQQQGLLDFLATQVPLGRVGEPRRDRACRRFPGLRRRQLRQRLGAFRRRRSGTGVVRQKVRRLWFPDDSSNSIGSLRSD